MNPSMTRTALINLMNKAGKTPALLAAFLIFLPQLLFCSGFYVFGFVVLILILILAVISFSLRCRDAAAAISFSLVISVLIAIPVLSNALNSQSAPTGPGRFTVTVISSGLRLDGKRRIIGETEDGVRIASVLPADSISCYPSDVIAIEGDMNIPSRATNQGEFDYRAYLERRGITRSVNAERVDLLSPGMIFSGLSRFIEDKRFSFIRAVLSDMDSDTAALTAALLFGDRSLLSDEMSRKFMLTGLNHLAAVSGTHFSGFLIILPYLFSLAGIRKRKITGTIYIVFCIAIGFLTSWTESVTRAALMNIGSFFGRDPLSSMSLAAILLILSDPYCVVSQGFLMSYAASLAIRFIVPVIRDFLTTGTVNLLKRTGFKKMNGHKLEMRISKIVTVFAVCIGCRLINCLFSDSVEIRLGPVMMLINIIASFMVTFICASFAPLCLAGGIVSFIAGNSGISSSALSFMVTLFSLFIDRASDLSYSSAGISCRPGYLITATVVFAVLCMIPQCMLKRILFKFSSLVLCASVGFYAADQVKYGAAKIVFIDVGQGDCALVMSGGKTALIDGGVTDEGLKTLPCVLDHYNISSVDYAIMSHWDKDHVGGLLSLVEQGRVKMLYSAYNIPDEQVEEILHDSLGLSPNECSIFLSEKVALINSGDAFMLSDNCRLDVIYPSVAKSGENEDSAVILLDSCGTKILFTGDIGMETEEYLESEGLLPDIDILKVAHHGSRFSTGSVFLTAVKPENAVVSVALNNPYGHPSLEALSRLEETDCRVYQTSLSGAVTVDAGLFGYRISEYVDERGDGSG